MASYRIGNMNELNICIWSSDQLSACLSNTTTSATVPSQRGPRSGRAGLHTSILALGRVFSASSSPDQIDRHRPRSSFENPPRPQHPTQLQSPCRSMTEAEQVSAQALRLKTTFPSSPAAHFPSTLPCFYTRRSRRQRALRTFYQICRSLRGRGGNR
jgi:hypothetical protein